VKKERKKNQVFSEKSWKWFNGIDNIGNGTRMKNNRTEREVKGIIKHNHSKNNDN